MKNTCLLIIVAVILLSCSYRTKTSEFLFLNREQLKTIGIHLTDQCLFYKNYNPNWKSDNERFPYFGFLANKSYLMTKQYGEDDILKAMNKYDRIFKDMANTKYDFYPVLVGNPKGEMSYNHYTKQSQNIKLLPIAICMSETKISNRHDTLIVWFKVTESLKQLLPQEININDYLQEPTIRIITPN